MCSTATRNPCLLQQRRFLVVAVEDTDSGLGVHTSGKLTGVNTLSWIRVRFFHTRMQGTRVSLHSPSDPKRRPLLLLLLFTPASVSFFSTWMPTSQAKTSRWWIRMWRREAWICWQETSAHRWCNSWEEEVPGSKHVCIGWFLRRLSKRWGHRVLSPAKPGVSRNLHHEMDLEKHRRTARDLENDDNKNRKVEQLSPFCVDPRSQ